MQISIAVERKMFGMAITIKSEREIELMQEACKITALTYEYIEKIREAGGKSFLAHAYIYKWATDKAAFINDIVEKQLFNNPSIVSPFFSLASAPCCHKIGATSLVTLLNLL